MKLLIGLIALFVAYVVAIYVVSKISVEKWGAKSGLFGAGIATMFMGFILHAVVVYSETLGYWHTGSDDVPLLYFVVSYGLLVMGLSGITMMAVGLLKTICASGKGAPCAEGAKPAQENIPAWKRVEMEQESK